MLRGLSGPLAASLLAAASFAGLSPAAAAGPALPGSVDARYSITFAGFDIGWFQFKSDVSDRTYKLAGKASISIGFGAFEWRAASHSTGTAKGQSPSPDAYTFEFQSNTKTGGIRMAFAGGRISELVRRPDKPPSPQEVPVQRQHLAGVFDPLSAVMALTVGSATNPCRKQLSIFDGKQRFDLEFAFAGRERLPSPADGSKQVVGFVCKVRYVPIAGYKPDSATTYMARNPGIRIVLRPVPQANVFVPHEIRVPTMAGDAILTARRVVITNSKQQRIALIQ